MIAILPDHPMSLVRMMPKKIPIESIATSRVEEARPNIKDWWYSSTKAYPTQIMPARSIRRIPRKPYTYKGKDTAMARRKYSVI